MVFEIPCCNVEAPPFLIFAFAPSLAPSSNASTGGTRENIEDIRPMAIIDLAFGVAESDEMWAVLVEMTLVLKAQNEWLVLKMLIRDKKTKVVCSIL
jgi:hypothetical protein